MYKMKIEMFKEDVLIYRNNEIPYYDFNEVIL